MTEFFEKMHALRAALYARKTLARLPLPDSTGCTLHPKAWAEPTPPGCSVELRVFCDILSGRAATLCVRADVLLILQGDCDGSRVSAAVYGFPLAASVDGLCDAIVNGWKQEIARQDASRTGEKLVGGVR